MKTLPLSELPPGGGVCFECSRSLYKDRRSGVWRYEEFTDEFGLVRARHYICLVGPDNPIFDDADNRRQCSEFFKTFREEFQVT